MLLPVLALLGLLAGASHGSPVVGCYVGTWAHYRQGLGAFNIEDVDAKLCTHLIYAFVGITGDGDLRSLDPAFDLPSGLNGFQRLVDMKKSNPAAKVLVSVGGWNEGSANFSKVANDAELRGKFSKNAAKFVKKYGFDGLDVHWKFPGLRGGAPSDKAAFVELLKATHAEFSAHKLLLTAAVPAPKDVVDAGFEVRGIMKHLDLAFLMAFDLRGSWQGKTGMHAATRAGPGETDNLNGESAIKLWLSRGGVASKMVLGLPLFGKSFTLPDAANATVGASVLGPGFAGPHTNDAGTLSFFEICEKQELGQFPEMWDEAREVPYAAQENQWISYDNPRSIQLKTQLAAEEYGLAGVVVWSLETDDFKKHCPRSGAPFPLLRAAHRTLFNVSKVSQPTVCGRAKAGPSELVLKGDPAAVETVPWHAAIYLERYGSRTYACGGSLVAPCFVVTAAHCVQGIEPVHVALGKFFSDWNSEEEPKIIRTKVKAVHKHQYFRGTANKLIYDIAVLELETCAVPSDKVGPICIDARIKPTSASSIKIAGWGNETTPLVELQSVTLTQLDFNDCYNSLSSNVPNLGYVTHDKFCAKRQEKSPFSGLLKGDSGGGAVVRRDGLWFLTGIVSGRLQDDKGQDVYALTDVAQYASWIDGFVGS